MHVVHVRKASYTHLVARPAITGNPFSHRASSFDVVFVATRAEAIRRWELYARGDEETVQIVRRHKVPWLGTPEQIREFIFALPEDAVLGCWCAPQPCHGDVIVSMWKEMHSGA